MPSTDKTNKEEQIYQNKWDTIQLKEYKEVGYNNDGINKSTTSIECK